MKPRLMSVVNLVLHTNLKVLLQMLVGDSDEFLRL
jgi:hypothetical protein